MHILRKYLLQHIPPASRHVAVEIKNILWGGWKQHYYSHAGEDIYLETYFRNQHHGFYVDVGAHHPKRYSNTALLYKRGWHGINIDPDSYAMKMFRYERKRDLNLQYGVGLQEQELEFHRYSDPAVNTFSQAEVERLRSKKWLQEIGVEKVSVKPLASILDHHMPPDTQIDFMNIDVEGLDFEVMQSNNWSKYKPKVLIVEDLAFDMEHPEKSALYHYALKQGFIFAAYLGLSLVFINQDHLKKR